MAGELPLLTIPAQLDLAPLQAEAVHDILLLILPDQVVVAKRQQGLSQLTVGKFTPELEIELAGDLGLTGVDPRQHWADVELAGAEIELAPQAIEPYLGGIHIQDEIYGALAHPVDEIGLADPLMAFAAVLPAQLGDIEGPHFPQRRRQAEAGIVNIERG
ncbi:hypothetical protein LAJPDJIK_02934 [Aeromonas salmonicida]